MSTDHTPVTLHPVQASPEVAEKAAFLVAQGFVLEERFGRIGLTGDFWDPQSDAFV